MPDVQRAHSLEVLEAKVQDCSSVSVWCHHMSSHLSGGGPEREDCQGEVPDVRCKVVFCAWLTRKGVDQGTAVSADKAP